MHPLYTLQHGDLFLCDVGAHKNRLFRYNHTSYRTDRKTIEYCWARQIAELVDGIWVTTPKCEIEKWNHVATVRRVKIEVIDVDSVKDDLIEGMEN